MSPFLFRFNHHRNQGITSQCPVMDEVILVHIQERGHNWRNPSKLWTAGSREGCHIKANRKICMNLSKDSMGQGRGRGYTKKAKERSINQQSLESSKYAWLPQWLEFHVICQSLSSHPERKLHLFAFYCYYLFRWNSRVFYYLDTNIAEST